MRTNLVLTTAPTVEPITVTDLKKHLRVTATDDDAYIKGLGTTARQWAEKYQDAAYLTQTWTLWLDGFPAKAIDIELPRRPIQSITHVKYYDTAGSATTWSTDNYMLDDTDGRVVLKYGKTWPSDLLQPAKGVEIQYVAGYTTTANLMNNRAYVPDAIKQIVAHWYSHREPVAMNDIGRDVPLTALALLDSDRPLFV